MATVGQQYRMHTGELILVGVAGVILLRDHTFVGVYEPDGGPRRITRAPYRRGAAWYLTPGEIDRNGKPETRQ